MDVLYGFAFYNFKKKLSEISTNMAVNSLSSTEMIVKIVILILYGEKVKINSSTRTSIFRKTKLGKLDDQTNILISKMMILKVFN